MKKLIILALLLSGCATVPQTTPDLQNETEQKLPVIKKDKGQFCVFRVAGMGCAICTFDVKLDEEVIGELSNGAYLCKNVIPGEYNISARGNSWTRASTDIVIKQGVRKFIELQAYPPSLGATTREQGLNGIYDTM